MNRRFFYDYRAEAGDGTEGGAGGAAAGTPGGAAGGEAAAGGNGSILAGAAGSAAPAGADGAAGASDGGHFIQEKYQVKKEDGTLDIEASARKVAEAHAALEKRLGTSELPPKSAEEYAPKIEIDGFNWDEFKADPDMQGFLKSAHAKGITNDQLSFVLNEYLQKVPQLVSGAQELGVEEATAELRKTWTTEQEFNANVNSAFKAFQAFADPADKDKIDAIGNNPIVLRMLAKIGKEMQEDTPIDPNSQAAQDWEGEVAKIRANPAYADSSHPEHKGLVNRMNTLYEKRYGKKAQMLGGGRTFQT